MNKLLTDEEHTAYLHRVEVGNPDAARWASGKIAEHHAALRERIVLLEKVREAAEKYVLSRWVVLKELDWERFENLNVALEDCEVTGE